MSCTVSVSPTPGEGIDRPVGAVSRPHDPGWRQVGDGHPPQWHGWPRPVDQGPRTDGQCHRRHSMIGPYERPGRPTTILGLLPMSPVASHFSCMREVSRNDNAGVAAVGEEKPRSDYPSERVEDHLRVVAHLAGPADKYMLKDSAPVQAFLERRMLHGLRLGIDDAALVGDGAVSAGRLGSTTCAASSTNRASIRGRLRSTCSRRCVRQSRASNASATWHGGSCSHPTIGKCSNSPAATVTVRSTSAPPTSR